MTGAILRGIGIALATTLGVLLAAGPASAQKPDYPKRTVTVVVPMGAGAGPDITTRYIVKRLEARLGQPFIVENKPGQAGGVGSLAVSRANPDGYTILMSFLSSNVFNPIIYKNLQYDPAKDLRFISMLYDSPFVVVVPTLSGIKTFKELVEKLKADPAKHTYGSGGVGSAAHVGAAMMLRITGTEGVMHVPFRTTAAVFPDLISNRIDFAMTTPDSVISYVQSGNLRPLVVTGPKRLASMPEVPTAAEVGYPDLRASSWYVLQAPAATPPEVVDFLNKEVNAVLNEPETQAWLAKGEARPLPGYTPEATFKFFEEEKARWEPHVRASGAGQ